MKILCYNSRFLVHSIIVLCTTIFLQSKDATPLAPHKPGTWFIYMCDMTQVCAWYNTFTCGTMLTYTTLLGAPWDTYATLPPQHTIAQKLLCNNTLLRTATHCNTLQHTAATPHSLAPLETCGKDAITPLKPLDWCCWHMYVCWCCWHMYVCWCCWHMYVMLLAHVCALSHMWMRYITHIQHTYMCTHTSYVYITHIHYMCITHI